jgi:hypothetical protein
MFVLFVGLREGGCGWLNFLVFVLENDEEAAPLLFVRWSVFIF